VNGDICSIRYRNTFFWIVLLYCLCAYFSTIQDTQWILIWIQHVTHNNYNLSKRLLISFYYHGRVPCFRCGSVHCVVQTKHAAFLSYLAHLLAQVAPCPLTQIHVCIQSYPKSLLFYLHLHFLLLLRHLNNNFQYKTHENSIQNAYLRRPAP
jgi:hypothetical protein